ncbi:Oxysterol-binding protein OBPa [Tieghemiomyces parasiticus]|uniref:Oxysterol-binding protein OBPa n=1 Tax=Tieghemiomyces parasiticus TaxID=78921 RepID=A0A9W8DU19_9FUNG|nr:Oxysterol-binding protein OBPa [Tieghemiomyces parasiticus]
MGKHSHDNDSQEVLDDEPRNIILGMIGQLRRDMDLSKVTFPTFVLEPRSFLERVTDFMTHPDILINATKVADPEARFVEVVKYYLSGWHIRPKGVKKPYNPVLGEYFRCQWKYEDNTEAFYISEQVSHHPPVSAYFYANPENGIYIEGDLRPKSRFLGNSVAMVLEGGTHIDMVGTKETFQITYPNMYARGILFGTMMLELGEVATVRCPQSDLVCEVEFKTKGFFSGGYNAISGKIKRISTGEVLYEISGHWTNVINIKHKASGKSSVLFDVDNAPCIPKLVAPEAEQGSMESRRLWSHVTAAMQARDLDTATDEKSKIEELQRQQRKERENEGVEWAPHFFVPKGDTWDVRIKNIPKKDPKAANEIIKQFIYSPSIEQMAPRQQKS